MRVMTTRILPPAEWPRLEGTLLESVWPALDPDRAQVIVAEEDGRIVGTAALFSEWHLEGAWTAPDRRKSPALGRALLRATREALAQLNCREVWMMAATPEGRRLCERMGDAIHIDCDHFAVQLERTHGRR